MKKIIAILILMLSASFSFAQKGSVTGLLLDSADQKRTLNYATVSVFKVGDSVLQTYKLSDDKGVFRVLNLQLDVKYRLVISAWQYKVLRKEIMLTAAAPDLNLGKLLLTAGVTSLNEVVVRAEIPPVVVRNDTIEFNAESFKTLPTAVVEDLLRKLPGVTVAADGSIKVNGKKVSRILVDGREFFGGDQKIATKNLPANIIGKVVVHEDNEAKLRDPFLVEGDIPQVIDLKLKKGIKQGAFGKLYAGGGANKLYEAGGIMNVFRDTAQVSLIAYGNNVNKTGFSMNDVSRIGGFGREGISRYSNDDGNYQINGVGFGGSSSGIQESKGAGANFNTLTKGGIKINAKYFYGEGTNQLEQLTAIDQNLGSNKLLSNSNLNRQRRTYAHNLGSKVEWNINKTTNLSFEPSVTINQRRNLGITQIENKNENKGLVSTGLNNSNLNENTTNYELFTNLYRRFKKPGRSINFSIILRKENTLSDNFNTAITNFYNPTSTTSLNQLRDNSIRDLQSLSNFFYDEPFGKKMKLQLSLNLRTTDSEDALYTFYKNPLNQEYDIAVPTLSQTVAQNGYRGIFRASLRWKSKDLTIQPGLFYAKLDLMNKFSSNPVIRQNYQFLAPSLGLTYKSLSLRYSPWFAEPDVAYLQPVANNTNPLFVQLGNPNLLPTKTHGIGFNYYKYDKKRSLNYNSNFNLNALNDAVIMERTVGAGGVQTSKPINVNGVLGFNGTLNVNKDFKNNKRQFSLGGGLSANYNRNVVSVNSIQSYAKNFQFAPTFTGRINLNDKFELGESYSMSYNKSTYDDPFYSDLNFYAHTSETELIVRLPKKMVWETNYRIQYNTQSIAGFSNNVKIWNAALTLLFLKNDRAQLKFAVNDILNTNTRRNVFITENSIRDVQSNNLGRHGLITLTYNVRNFGAKVGGKEPMFRF